VEVVGVKTRSVLVVEDQPEVRKLLGERLEQLGFTSIEASDGRTAMNCLAQHAPDLVCLDLILPESSGYEICNYIRATPHLRNVLVLMMSGRRLADEGAFAEEAGADAFLGKPFSTRDFERSVKELFEARAATETAGDE
jgi:CheY-like chemotaxis protein